MYLTVIRPARERENLLCILKSGSGNASQVEDGIILNKTRRQGPIKIFVSHFKMPESYKVYDHWRTICKDLDDIEFQTSSIESKCVHHIIVCTTQHVLP